MPAPDDDLRWCRTGHYAPVAEMVRDRHRPDGIDTICRPCKAARRRERTKAGLCSECGAPAEPGRTYCADHLAAKRERRRERVDAGLCIDCGEPAAPGRRRCAEHLGALRAYNRARIEDGRHAADNRARRQRYRAQGLCERGPGHGPATHGVYCARCRARAQKKHRKTLIEFTAILADQGVDHDGRCELCGLAEATQVDHVLPRTLGGIDDDPLLLRWVCATCNASRGNNTAWVPALTAWDVEEQLSREEDR